MKSDYFYESYRHATYYESLYGNINEDLNFWKSIASHRNKKCLELACGTGRVSIPLIDYGVDLTALDYSKDMLDIFEEKLRNQNKLCRLVHGDMRKFSLNVQDKYDSIIITSNSVNHIETWDDLESVFKECFDHLNKGGLLAFDILNPNPKFLTRSKDEKSFERVVKNIQGGYFKHWECAEYLAKDQLLKVKYYYIDCDSEGSVLDDDIKSNDVNVRLYYPQEFDYFVNKSPFILENKFDWYQNQTFTGTKNEQLYILRKNS